MLSRRRLLKALLSGPCLPLASHYWQAAAASGMHDEWPVLDVDAGNAASFRLFLALSQMVTLRATLDRQVARRMHPLFLDEPWGPHHIQSTYLQLVEAAQGGAVALGPSTAGQLGEGQAWFVNHLLTTWYLGIYYHERMPPVRVAYAEALMYAAVHPWLPAPFNGYTGFGRWGMAPEPRSRS